MRVARGFRYSLYFDFKQMEISDNEESINICNEFLIELVALIKEHLVPVNSPFRYATKKLKFTASKDPSSPLSNGLTFVFTCHENIELTGILAIVGRAFVKCGFFRPVKVTGEAMIFQPLGESELQISDWLNFKRELKAATGGDGGIG